MSRSKHPFVATAQLLAGAALLFCIWRALPARYLPVDVGGSVLGALLVCAGLALYTGRPWARMVAIMAASVCLLLGVITVVLLAYGVGAVAGMIPVTPGGLGFVEAGLVGTLALAGIGGEQALLATLAYRIASYWLPLLAGLVGWIVFRRRYGSPPPDTNGDAADATQE